MIPDLISIERLAFKLPTDGPSKHRASLKDMGIDILNEDLEGHFDSALGTFVLNSIEVWQIFQKDYCLSRN